MSTRTIWISDSVWRSLSPDLRDCLVHILGNHDEIIDRYAANVENDLRARGEHDLARWLLLDLKYQQAPFDLSL